MKPRECDQFPAVLGPDGQQIETFGRIQKTHVSSDTAEGYQKGDFPERDCTDEPKRRGVERLTFIGPKPLRRDPRPKNDVRIDEEGNRDGIGSNSSTTSSGNERSSASAMPRRSPYWTGRCGGSGPRHAAGRPFRVTMMFSPASARATSEANFALACATETVLPISRFMTINGHQSESLAAAKTGGGDSRILTWRRRRITEYVGGMKGPSRSNVRSRFMALSWPTVQ